MSDELRKRLDEMKAAAPRLDPSSLIEILWDAITTANDPEQLEGYFQDLIDDDDVTEAVRAYTGKDV